MTILRHLLSEDLSEGVASFRVKSGAIGMYTGGYMTLPKALTYAKERAKGGSEQTIHAKHFMTGAETHTHTVHPDGKVEQHRGLM